MVRGFPDMAEALDYLHDNQAWWNEDAATENDQILKEAAAEIRRLRDRTECLEARLVQAEGEARRLAEFEWMYKELCK